MARRARFIAALHTGSAARFGRARIEAVLVVLAALLLSPVPAHAQGEAYPSKPIKIIVNFAPGGLVDVLGRIIATQLTETLGQPVTVDNRTGASGNIGAEAVAKSKADGLTLLMTAGGVLTTNHHLFPNMTFHPLKDLTPITQVARIPNLLVARGSLPAKNVAEFIAYLRANMDKATYGSAGTGTAAHLSAEMLNAMAGVSARQIPYKGYAAAVPDLITGRIDFMFDSGTTMSHVASGEMKLLAVGSASRLGQFPDTPSLGEPGGIPGYDFDSVHSIVAPADTPKDIIARLNREIVKILKTPEIEKRILTMGAEVMGNSPEAAAAALQADYDRIGGLIKTMGIKAN